MTKENPRQVIPLLAVAMVSMFVLFVVTMTNASFSQTETTFPDPFAPQKIVAMLDNASSGYSQFLTAYLFQPAQTDLAFYSDNAKWVIDESADPILAMTGLTDLASVQYYENLERAQQAPKVAGAYTQSYQSGGFGINSLYSVLIQ